CKRRAAPRTRGTHVARGACTPADRAGFVRRRARNAPGRVASEARPGRGLIASRYDHGRSFARDGSTAMAARSGGGRAMPKRLLAGTALAIVVLLATALLVWRQSREDAVVQESAGVVQDDSGRRVLYWYDPMVPAQRFKRPGKSPFMDM